MTKVMINGQEIEVAEGLTILQACETINQEVPYFCYHPKLSIAGNCRMCLVEVEKSPKLVASCAMPVQEGMIIHTNSQKVVDARKGVLELLLINHPLDCPICDQGGECDLQDLTMNYGPGKSRFDLNKRAVADKYMGPLVKTVMTRCIHCTRCIRFSNEVAGVPEMGAIGRGEHVEITSYLEGALTSELSGNLIDICPVGALTNKPYAFHGRPWELRKTESISIMTAEGSNIRIDSRDGEVMRILPRLNEEINEDWIDDKTRFSYDGLKYQRLDRPYIKKSGKLEEASWEEAFKFIQNKLNGLKGQEIAAIAGDQADCESMVALKDLMTDLKSPWLECRYDGENVDPSNRSSYLFNTSIEGIENSDLALLIGTNIRTGAPLINARIRKRYLQGDYDIFVIGEKSKMTYPHEHLGEQVSVLKEIEKGTHALCKVLKKKKNPMLILGQGLLTRRDGQEVLSLCQKIAEKYGFVKDQWNGFNVLHYGAARVGGLEIGFVPQKDDQANIHKIFDLCKEGVLKAVYLLNCDEIPMESLGDAFVIYQGHHGDKGAHRADVILPGCAFTEKSATYVNVEGRAQQTNTAVEQPGDAKHDWKIIRALSDYIGETLPYNTLKEVRHRLSDISPTFQNIGKIYKADWKISKPKTPETLSQKPIESNIQNFYMTDPISRHSKIMAECVKAMMKTKEEDRVRS